jgi:hypothetical protein
LVSGAALASVRRRVPAMTLVFAVGLGVGNGVISILRPVVIREVMGDGGLRRKRRGRGAPVALRLRGRPGPRRGSGRRGGLRRVLALCVLSPLAGALLLRRLPRA